MSPNRSIRRAAPPVLAAALALPAQAAAHEPAYGGAAVAPAPPAVNSLRCATGDRRSCPRGAFLAIRGEGLRSVDSVVFVGGSGRSDDRRASPRRRSPHRVLVQVPADAQSGRLRVVSGAAGTATTSRRFDVIGDEPTPPPVAEGAVFPVSGSYRFGTSTNRFGGSRSHKGQDIFADCGTPVVAALGGEVASAGYEGGAGNYAVITADDRTSHVYMHMQRKPLVKQGERVEAGESLGAVGESGSAQGCHLHFELWTAPGWYRGGEAVDPLPTLRRWSAGA
jgi:murein DD-endopeptidase MepM/ murein hydrolase activator NlpD